MILSNEQSEVYCLAAAMKSVDSLTLVIENLTVEHFDRPIHKTIFSLILELGNTNSPVTISSVNALGASKKLFDDKAMLMDMTYEAHKTSEVPTHIELLEEAKKSRNYEAALKVAVDKSTEEGSVSEKIVSHLSSLENIISTDIASEISQVAELLEKPYKTSDLNFREYVDKKINENAQGIKSLSGISTGFEKLDTHTDGLQPAWLYVIGARPSEGKSQFLMNMIVNVAEQNVPCLFFSLEMPAGDVMTEILSIVGGYDHKRMKSGMCHPLDLPKLDYAVSKVKEMPIYIDDQPSLNTIQMKARIKRMIRNNGIKVIFIDYLQEVTAAGRFNNQQEKMQEVSRNIREMAKEFEIPIVCAAQVNRESEKSDKAMPPQASHLRESGQIEQCAWFIGMLHRPDKYDANDFPGILQMYVRKNRFGERTLIQFNYNADAPAYSYRITELQDVKKQIDSIHKSNQSRKDDGGSFERFTPAQ